jgi:hypothetical protein
MFTNGFYVLGFDLTPDRDADEEHLSLLRQGNVHIALRFKNTTRTRQMHFYAKFPGDVEIDNLRNVTLE